MLGPDSNSETERILGDGARGVEPDGAAGTVAPSNPPRAGDEPHPRLPQYTTDEAERGFDVFRLLIKVRDRGRAQGLIDW